jgi:tetratricopeptide (TPR) repeat protein
MQPSETQHAVNPDGSVGARGGGNGRLLATAAILARKGRYAEAAHALDAALAAGECSAPEAMDLRARMYAQQGLNLEAESCWEQAKRLDGENPAYDRALARLRQARLPEGRVLPLAAAAAALAVLALLLWQAFGVNPTISDRLGATDTSLATMQGDVAGFRDAAQGADQKLAANLAELDGRLAALDARLSERLDTLATTAETARDRDALLARLDEQADALRASLDHQVAQLDERHGETDAARAETLAALETNVAEIAKAVASLRRTLERRVHAIESELAARVDRVEASVEQGLESAATAADAEALAGTLTRLDERLAEIAADVEQLKVSPPRRRRPSPQTDAADAAIPDPPASVE